MKELLCYIIQIVILILCSTNYFLLLKSKIKNTAHSAINDAEQKGKTGEEKMALAVSYVKNVIPRFLRFFFSNSKISAMIQETFDVMEQYAQKQIGGDNGGSRL